MLEAFRHASQGNFENATIDIAVSAAFMARYNNLTGSISVYIVCRTRQREILVTASVLAQDHAENGQENYTELANRNWGQPKPRGSVSYYPQKKLLIDDIKLEQKTQVSTTPSN